MSIRQWMKTLRQHGNRPVESGEAHHQSPDRYSLMTVIRYGSLVGGVGHFAFIFTFLWLGIWQMAMFNIISCLIFLYCYKVNQRGGAHLAVIIGIGEVVTHAILSVAFLGWNSGFHYYILGLVPLVFYSRHWGIKNKMLLVSSLFLVYLSLYGVASRAVPWHPVEDSKVFLIGGYNIAVLFIVFAVISHFYRSAAAQAELSLLQANQTLEYLAHTDALTKLLNRRCMLEAISKEMMVYDLTRRPFSIVMGDIDNFKNFNDTYGHEAGDQILMKVAEVLIMGVRVDDKVSRWGGEEILILLPGASSECAISIAERLRASVAGAPLTFDGKIHQITMTFGVATYAPQCEAADCIRQADQAMYEGKRQGKNRVVVHA